MATPNYTSAQIRSILNGWGHRTKTAADGPNFPISEDNSPLTDALTVEAIKKFQREYGLTVDGIVGPITKNKAAEVVSGLQLELNACVKSGIPDNQLFYGPQTMAAVKALQAKLKLAQDGIASNSLRVKLYDLYKTGKCPL